VEDNKFKSILIGKRRKNKIMKRISIGVSNKGSKQYFMFEIKKNIKVYFKITLIQ
jgi:hypothetical protein